MSPYVTIDVRLLGVTGIGTYIEHVVPRVIERWPEARFTLLGDPDRIGALGALGAPDRVRVRRFTLPIYTMQEQLAYPLIIPRETDLFWAPHYNVPLAHRGRLAVMVHDVIHLALPEASPLRRTYARRMFQHVRRHADLVLCNSHYTARDFCDRVGTPAALTVAPLGVDERWFQLGAAVRQEHPYFLYVGNVKPHKNLLRLLQAFAEVATELPHRLLIVGPREGLRTMDQAALDGADALGDRVEFTGRVDRAALERFVASCDALIVPSLYEGFGLPALEALAAGRAVGASRVASLPEVCGSEAIYFDPYDVRDIAACLRRLGTRPTDEPRDLARRRDRAREFTWNRCAEITQDALRESAGTHAGTRVRDGGEPC